MFCIDVQFCGESRVSVQAPKLFCFFRCQVFVGSSGLATAKRRQTRQSEERDMSVQVKTPPARAAPALQPPKAGHHGQGHGRKARKLVSIDLFCTRPGLSLPARFALEVVLLVAVSRDPSSSAIPQSFSVEDPK